LVPLSNNDRNKKSRYSATQILSVLLVTLGVALTTLSASGNTTDFHTTVTTTKANPYTYATGISILTLALLLSGFLGLVQDWTYSRYGRPVPPGNSNDNEESNPASETPNGSYHNLKQAEKKSNSSSIDASAWQESMFYLHLLALPMFISIRKDLAAQFVTINAGPRFSVRIPIPLALDSSISPFIQLNPSSFVSMSPSQMEIHIPITYLSLLMNTLTQLLCVAGVHRLTTRVSALSVTLVLVVRKAASLVMSVVGFGILGDSRGMRWEKTQKVNVRMMWIGALMVLLGSVGYSVATGSRGRDKKRTKDKRQ
jgi:UDP-xylose/UDP-N-acetylglucosamine transporter B4